MFESGEQAAAYQHVIYSTKRQRRKAVSKFAIDMNNMNVFLRAFTISSRK